MNPLFVKKSGWFVILSFFFFKTKMVSLFYGIISDFNKKGVW
ncbi:putative membrane protein [Helicobacter pylori Hp H-19]|nr:putative membrane protein [Helicobacter pylori Hp H-19]